MIIASEVIKKCRKESGYSIQRLARESGIGAPTICNWEHEIHTPNVFMFEVVLNAMGYELEIIKRK